MFKKDVLAHFDPVNSRPSITAKALGITPGAVSLWGETVPELRAREVHEITAGKLEFNAELYAAIREEKLRRLRESRRKRAA